MSLRLVAAALALASASAKTVPATTVTYDTRACQAPYNTYPFCDQSLPLQTRINDLIQRLEPSDIPQQLTARHSASQLSNISRLGVPEYDWGMNAIHGVQSSCIQVTDGSVLCPTSFPNPVCYGMSWNKTLFYDLGRFIGREARALWLAGATEESGIKPHIGLDAWSPNINIARDPRWGRNQEVCGEDPKLNGDFGAGYTLGIQQPDPSQGGDARYLQVISTLKHWDAYSLENSDNFTRHNFDAIVSNFTLADTYFPAFKESVIKGNAKGVMCAYNSINGQPACANKYMTSVLRGEWAYDGYISSDSGAVEDIYEQHFYVNTSAEAACVAIRDGTTDVCSGGVYTSSLLQAVASGLCSQADVNLALYHTFFVRFSLGLFDTADNAPYWHVDTSLIGAQDASDNAMLATLEGQVLLHNDGNVLPLNPGMKLALIGPHANATSALVGNYLGQLCPDDTFDCIVSPFGAITAMNAGGTTTMEPGCPLVNNDTSGFAAAVSAAQAADVVVMFLGIDLTVEGEANDRRSIDLPYIQHQLASAVAAVGKPTVIVLINGGMVDITQEKMNPAIGAMLEVGYPGQRGATGIAMSLFGTNTHLGGKLPYTMYPADYVNLIEMSEMELDVGPGRTYRYYSGETVYPFGYGISLTTFSVVPFTAAAEKSSSEEEKVPEVPSYPSALTVTRFSTSEATIIPYGAARRTVVASGRVMDYAVNITNTGTRTGDEVVQAYFVPLDVPGAPDMLLKQLYDYQRVHLDPGQSQIVTFSASADTFVVVDKATGDRVSSPGIFDIVFTDGVHHDAAIRHRVIIEGPAVVVEPFPGRRTE